MAKRVSLILILIWTATGCTGERGSTERPKVGDPAPAYRAPDLQGDTVVLAELRGEPVLLNIWATWCAPCRFETPFLQSVFEKHRSSGLRVVGVSVDQRGSTEAVEAFLRKHGVTYPILRDPEMRAMDTFYVLGLPATFLIDASGVVRFMRMGPVEEGDEEFLQALAEVVS